MSSDYQRAGTVATTLASTWVPMPFVPFTADAMGDMQKDSGDRIFPMAMLPWWDVEASVKEAERCLKWGMRGININPDPHDHGVPSLDCPEWKPLIYACTFFERKNFVDTVRQVGADNIMFETDFPHPACLYPDGLDYMVDVLAELTPEERSRFSRAMRRSSTISTSAGCKALAPGRLHLARSRGYGRPVIVFPHPARKRA